MIMLALYEFLNTHEWQNTVIFFWLIVFLLIFHACLLLLSNIFIFGIDFYSNEQKMVLNMFRSSRSYEIHYNDVDKIHVNLYVSFHFKGKRLLYRGVDEKPLIEFLKKQEKVSWGKFWKYLAGK